jgi:hypothetical protein
LHDTFIMELRRGTGSSSLVAALEAGVLSIAATVPQKRCFAGYW